MPDLIGTFTKDSLGIYFINTNQTIAYPPEASNIYFEIEDNSFWFKHRNKVIANFVKKYLKRGVLTDVGGGNGVVAKFLQSLGVPTILIEPNYLACKNARQRGLTDVYCAKLQDFANNSFEAVGLFDVLEHIKDDAVFLINAKKRLQENGLIFITVPAYQWLWSSEDVVANHVQRYNHQRLIKVLNTAGFEIVDYTYFFQILVLSILLFRKFFGFRKLSNPQADHHHHSAIINWFLTRESRAVLNHRLNWGASLLVVARRV